MVSVRRVVRTETGTHTHTLIASFFVRFSSFVLFHFTKWWLEKRLLAVKCIETLALRESPCVCVLTQAKISKLEWVPMTVEHETIEFELIVSLMKSISLFRNRKRRKTKKKKKRWWMFMVEEGEKRSRNRLQLAQTRRKSESSSQTWGDFKRSLTNQIVLLSTCRERERGREKCSC